MGYRSRFSIAEKRLILRENSEGGESIAFLARKYRVHPVTIYQWRRMIDLSDDLTLPHEQVGDLLDELEKLKKENKKLKTVVGELTLDRSCQRDIIDLLKKKTSRRSLAEVAKEIIDRGHKISRACRLLGRSHQWLYDTRRRQKQEIDTVRRFYDCSEDEQIIPLIKAVMKKRPTYGYKRVTSMLNKEYGKNYNKKRIYRLMKKSGMLLPKVTSSGQKREHTGKVMVLKPNTRWCIGIW